VPGRLTLVTKNAEGRDDIQLNGKRRDEIGIFETVFDNDEQQLEAAREKRQKFSNVFSPITSSAEF
jgi:hypothetical protein